MPEYLVQYGETIGYLASGLVFLTFCMKTMMPLRLIAIASNVAFIGYGALFHLLPIFILHTLLLPLNVLRTWQMWQLVRRTSDSENSEIGIRDLVPLMSKEKFRAGDMVFHKGDISAKLYYLDEGQVRIEEYGVVLDQGSLFGEISLFSEDKARTASVRCVSDCRLFSLSEDQVKLLYFQNPRFGYYVIRLVAQRLIQNVRRLEAEKAAAAAG